MKSEVALINDYNSRWSINWQRHNKAFDPVEALKSYYGPVRELVRSVDVVSDTAPLSGYKLVVAPALNVLTPEAVKNLEAYVRGGGHLVLGQRSGMKDEDNTLYPERQPGPLAGMLGARVEQWYALQQPVPVTGDWGSGTSPMWAEQIGVKSPDTKVLMRYGTSNGWLDGQPAAVTRKVGKGSITYIGAGLDEATMKQAAKWMVEESGAKTFMADVPETVEVSVREGDGRHVVIMENLGESTTVTLPQAMSDVLKGGSVSSVKLEKYGVAVLKF
ncbi:MAG: beta-galactosidase trimerization domain-containing protein [Edaphobacter sp.]|uniref:beta-galactosidase trimerization domain-containing protein n=1 Tax=Edaphobacter sp. TaxID=1934404 RepID=UPI002386405E|nr:beta-galactosidase trimerization domain-containing protein [Edaphobacter sp.]MDE1176927.1 beta-galactosidase trimerization domain-containing protein [Edaphobacter sp.]